MNTNKENTLYVYCDDTGLAGNPSRHDSLNELDKAYVAVLVDQQDHDVINDLLVYLTEELKRERGADEFHFTDIYNGKGNFECVSDKEKYSMFQMFTEIFNLFELTWQVQSYNKSTKKLMQNLFANQAFDEMTKREKRTAIDLQVVTLLMKQVNDLCVHSDVKYDNIEIIMDEGILPKDQQLDFSKQFKKVAKKATMTFKSSEQCKMLQLADFTAYSFLRQQVGIEKAIQNLDNPKNYYVKMQKLFNKMINYLDSEKVIAVPVNKNTTIEDINKAYQEAKKGK